MHKATHMGEDPIPALLYSFSLPAITGMIATALYNIVDRIFIGQGVGPLGIAGATVGFPIMQVQMAFGMLVGLGATATVSIRLGQQKKEEAEEVLGNAFTLLCITSVVLTAIGLIFLDPMLRLFGASDAVLPYAREYMYVIVLGTVFQAVGFGLNNVIRGEGNPRIAMQSMFVGAGLNTLLDPVFIFGLHLGVTGAAIATVISQAAVMTWVLLHFSRKRGLLHFHRAHLPLRWPIVRPIIAIGSAPFAMHIVASVLNAFLNNQLQRYGGDLAISAMGIIFSLAMVILMPIFGLNQGAQPIIGYNFGAKSYDRVLKTLRLAIKAASVVTVAGFVIAQSMPHFLIQFFSPHDPALIELGTRALRLFFLMLPVVGFQVVSSSYFQAVGKPKHAIFLSLSRQVIFLIPAIWLFPLLWGLDGLWLATPFADALSALLTATFLWKEWGKMKTT